jgi:hypothetical protein
MQTHQVSQTLMTATALVQQQQICYHNNKHTYVCRIIIEPLTTAAALIQQQISVITTNKRMQDHQNLDCHTCTTTDLCDHNNKHTYVCRIIIKPLTTAAALIQQQICVITTTSIPMYAGSSSNP